MAGRFHKLIMPGVSGVPCAFCHKEASWTCAESYTCGPVCEDHFEHNAGDARRSAAAAATPELVRFDLFPGASRGPSKTEVEAAASGLVIPGESPEHIGFMEVFARKHLEGTSAADLTPYGWFLEGIDWARAAAPAHEKEG